MNRSSGDWRHWGATETETANAKRGEQRVFEGPPPTRREMYRRFLEREESRPRKET